MMKSRLSCHVVTDRMIYCTTPKKASHFFSANVAMEVGQVV